jgi:hypothetical protein
VKKACGVDQYGAPPMDWSKDGQAGAPATTVVTVASKVPAMPTAGPMRALTPAVRKRGSTEGWGARRRCLRGRQ